MDTQLLQRIVQDCRQSVSYFIENYCKIKHPLIGVMPVQLFKYQKTSLLAFRRHRFNVFKKTRQCGISTLSGIYALWMAMFLPYKKILIVSQRDQDAKDFLSTNIKFIYDHLPKWMRKLWPDVIRNEHELGFPNGSVIRSLTSSPNTLRSNVSSLNIIDEAAFIDHMDAMWASGWSTMQHGGRAIVISTPCGQGNWYWETWMDATQGDSMFNPILINWWNMDWVIEAPDPVSGDTTRIAPTDGIRKCTTKEEIEKYGPYWSPWLEKEYQGLKARGEAHRFKQEVLGEFVGGGNTFFEAPILIHTEKTVNDAPQAFTIEEPVEWTNQSTDEVEYLNLDGSTPNEGIWIWKKPIRRKSPKFKNGKLTDHGEPGHTYVMGVDIATGENNDYSAIEIFDIDTMEQVTEYMARVKVRQLAKIADWLGRWYNTALMCPERTGIGSPFTQNVEEFMYPNVWQERKIVNGKVSLKQPGYSSGGTNARPRLDVALRNYITDDDNGFTIYSNRLLSQLKIYVRYQDRQGRTTKKTGAQKGRGNYDDLVLAAALAFIATPDAAEYDPVGMLPIHNTPDLSRIKKLENTNTQESQKDIASKYSNPHVMMPLTFNNLSDNSAVSQQEQINAFAKQLISKQSNIPATKKPKHIIHKR